MSQDQHEYLLDEAQEAVGPNLSILMEQARSMGIRLVLAHHNLEHLRRADTDYPGTFEENTGLHVVFNPVASMSRRGLEESSGRQLYAALSWERDLRPLPAGARAAAGAPRTPPPQRGRAPRPGLGPEHADAAIRRGRRGLGPAHPRQGLRPRRGAVGAGPHAAPRQPPNIQEP